MKRSLRVWIGLGFVALAAAVALVSKRQPDELDVIRKYRPKSEKLIRNEVIPDYWFFEFDQVPLALHAELGTTYRTNGRWLVWPHSFRTPELMGNVSRGNTQISVHSTRKPSWIERQWKTLQRWASRSNDPE